MKKIADLKKDLGSGDNIRISQISKVPLSTVNAVMSGVRNANKGQGLKVLIAANKLVESRKSLLDDTADEQPELPFAKEVA